MPFHFSQFVSTHLDSKLQCELQQLPALPAGLRHCLLTGPPHSGRTTLLFHYAYSHAAAQEHVLFVTRREEVEFDAPLLPAGVPKDDPALQRIQMRYLDTLADVKKLAASIHLLEQPPAAIIVDNLSGFEHAGGNDRQHHEHELMAALSYLHDAVQWAGSASRQCTLLVSEVAAADGPRMLFLYQRWLPLVMQITELPAGGSSRLMLAASVADRHDVDPACCVGLDFSISKHMAVALEGITQLA